MNLLGNHIVLIAAIVCINFMHQCSSQKLLVLMLDGVSWDYYENLREKLPGLTKFISEGVRAEWVEPIFPVKTFPSLATIATGVFPENHGIIDCYMMDRNNYKNDDDQEKFLRGKTSTRQWMKSEPIWTTVTKQNKKAYVFQWAFNNISYDEILPAKFEVFKHGKVDWDKSLEKVLRLLSQDFSLAMVYYNVIDHHGHVQGPFSAKTNETVINFDSELVKFMEKLERSRIKEELNIILLSDHGMTPADLEKDVISVELSDYLTLDYVDRILGSRTVVNIAAFPNSTEQLYLELKEMRGIDVYKKEDIPDNFHYKKSPYVLDFIAVAKPGYTIISLYDNEKHIPSPKQKNRNVEFITGDHGYVNITEMRGVFYARGPAFKKGHTHYPIRLEDEYQIFAKILQIPALPNNGSWSRIAAIFDKKFLH